jgi:hypothetical protein
LMNCLVSAKNGYFANVASSLMIDTDISFH